MSLLVTWVSSLASKERNLKRPVAGIESTRLVQELWKLPTWEVEECKNFIDGGDDDGDDDDDVDDDEIT